MQAVVFVTILAAVIYQILYITKFHYWDFLQKMRLPVLGGSSEIFSQSKFDATISNPLQKNFNWEGKTCWKTKDASVKHGFKTSNLCYMITGKIYILVRGKMFES